MGHFFHFFHFFDHFVEPFEPQMQLVARAIDAAAARCETADVRARIETRSKAGLPSSAIQRHLLHHLPAAAAQ